jgi:hypothetical protein
MPCHDCAEVTARSCRAFRSGSNDDIAAAFRSSVPHIHYPEYRGVVGSRCARNPQGASYVPFTAMICAEGRYDCAGRSDTFNLIQLK